MSAPDNIGRTSATLTASPDLSSSANAIADDGRKVGWRPIASAPRDGTVVLLSDGHSVVPGAFVPALHGEEWPWAFVDGFADAPQGCCNMEDDTRVQTNGFKEAGVTHWMPLPSAPSQDTEMGK